MSAESLTLYMEDESQLLEVGKDFASLYLRPLLDSGLPFLQSLVVAAYGPSGIGKSPFFHGCSLELSEQLPWVFNKNGWVEQFVVDDKLYRFCDFGKSSFISTVPLPKIAPRASLQQPGIDFYEHSPISSIDSGGAIVTIAEPDLSPNYGDAWKKWIDNVKGNLTPPQQATRRQLLSQFASTQAELNPRKVSLVVNPIPENMPRVICIAPTTTEPFAEEAFRDFKFRSKAKFGCFF